jgi:ribonuclease HI
MTSRIKVFFDGGCRPNPGVIEVAAVIGGEAHIVRDLGHGTNGDAEWLALIHALRTAQELGLTDIVLLGDSQAVVRAAAGTVKARGAAQAHLAAFDELAGADRPHVRYVKRAQNLAGIALARLHPR